MPRRRAPLATQHKPNATLKLPLVESGLVLRSALTLKGLVHHDTRRDHGRHTSLPEERGGIRNRDHQRCRLRDANFVTSYRRPELDHCDRIRLYMAFQSDKRVVRRFRSRTSTGRYHRAMPEQILEPDGTLWKPEPWATASAEEFSAARALIISLNEERRWNPWVAEDRADDLAAADAVFDQWTRAEPDFRPLSNEEIDERLKTQDARIAARVAHHEAERLARVAHFDEDRAAARLRLLEREAQLEHALDDRAALASGERAPAMDPSRRAAEIAELDTRIDQMRTDVDRLRVLIGDPESVVDEHGRLPANRRAITHMYFRIQREQEVRQLRASVSGIEQRLTSKGLDKSDRASLRRKLASDSRQLTQLAAMPPLTEADMCSECVSPSSWHGYTKWGGDFRDVAPCPAWPDWAAHLRRVRPMLTVPAVKETVPATPRPQPLAVIPSGLPIAEVLRRLKDLQVEHPDAEVRRGARNKWEIWPAAQQGVK